MFYVINIRNCPMSYAGQEHFPFLLDVPNQIHEQGNVRCGNLFHGWIGQCEQAMD